MEASRIFQTNIFLAYAIAVVVVKLLHIMKEGFIVLKVVLFEIL
jgi:hypothetical protein